MSKTVAKIEPEMIDEPKRWASWRFWRNIFLLFVLGSWVGHIIELVWATFKVMAFGPEAWGYVPKTIFWLAEPYGIGAVLLVMFVAPLMKKFGWIRVFIVSVLVTTFAELVSALVVFCATGANSVWDYSGRPFNLWGMICLQNSLLFGVCSLGFLYLLLPKLDSMERKVDQKVWNTLFGVLVATYPIYAVWKVQATLL